MKSVRLAAMIPLFLITVPNASFSQTAKGLKPPSEYVSTSGVAMNPKGAQIPQEVAPVQKSEAQIIFDLKSGKPITSKDVELLIESFQSRAGMLATGYISQSMDMVRERINSAKDSEDVVASLERLHDVLSSIILSRTTPKRAAAVVAETQDSPGGIVIPTEDKSIKHYTASMFDPNPVARLLQSGQGLAIFSTSDKLLSKYFTPSDQSTKQSSQDALLFTGLVLKFQNDMAFNKADNEALSRIWGSNLRPTIERDKLKDANLALKLGQMTQAEYDSMAASVRKELDKIDLLLKSGDTKGALAAIQNGNYSEDLSNFRDIIKNSDYRMLTGKYYTYASLGYGVRVPLYNSGALQEANAGVLRKTAIALDLYCYLGFSVLGQEALVKPKGVDMDDATKKLLTTILTSGRIGPSMSVIHDGQEMLTVKAGFEGNYMWVKEMGNVADLSVFANVMLRVPVYDIKNHQIFLYGTGDMTYTIARLNADKALNARGAVGMGVEVLENAMAYVGATGRLGLGDTFEPGLEAGFRIKISKKLNFGVSVGMDDLGRRNSFNYSIEFSSRF